jgi:hydrogenase-4 component E
MQSFPLDLAHMFAGGLVLASFAMLYQDRLLPLINMLSVHSLLLGLSVGWQAHIQQAPELYVTAVLAIGLKCILIPVALQRMVRRMGLHREIEGTVGTGIAMLIGIGLVALSMDLMLKVTAASSVLVREDLALALSVVLLGLLMMVTRRNAVSQVIGFMSLENGLVLAGTGAHGMPLIVEISIAFSILIAFIVIGIYLFRIRERFDTVDLETIDHFRGEHP